MRSVGVDLPIAAAQVLCDKLANKIPAGVKFRFVYCSSKHTEKSKKTLMFTTDTRKLANDLEKGIANIVTKNKDIFEAYTLRPATFAAINAATQPDAAPASKKLVGGLGHGATTVIEPSRVGRAMAVVASDGWKEKIVENEAIIKLSN